jgi:hypothetical protein
VDNVREQEKLDLSAKLAQAEARKMLDCPKGVATAKRPTCLSLAIFQGSSAPKKMAGHHFIREKREPNGASILRSGKHASRTKQWRAFYMTPAVHRGFRTN